VESVGCGTTATILPRRFSHDLEGRHNSALQRNCDRGGSNVRRQMVSLAAEFAVASELCRRDIYAQLTLGHQKRTDLLIFSEDDELLRIEVKGKQGRSWPNCKGIYGSNVVLVLVDFRERGGERPDFYVLTEKDWVDFVKGGIEEARAKGKRVELNDRNVPVWLDQVNAQGQPYRGMGIRPEKIQHHKEKWDKIIQAVAKKSHRV